MMGAGQKLPVDHGEVPSFPCLKSQSVALASLSDGVGHLFVVVHQEMLQTFLHCCSTADLQVLHGHYAAVHMQEETFVSVSEYNALLWGKHALVYQ